MLHFRADNFLNFSKKIPNKVIISTMYVTYKVPDLINNFNNNKDCNYNLIVNFILPMNWCKPRINQLNGQNKKFLILYKENG